MAERLAAHGACAAAARNGYCRKAHGSRAPISAPSRCGPLVLGLEDYYGQGAAAAVAGHTPDGRVLVYGRLAARRAIDQPWSGYR